MTTTNTKKFPLTIESDTLNAFKSDFNQMLRKLLRTMEQQEAEEGKLTAQITVKLTPGEARDFEANGHDAMRDIITPKFDHKVGISMQFKDEKTGSLGGGYEMLWDKEMNAYVMVSITNGQTSIFDQPEAKQPEPEKKPEKEEEPEVIEADGNYIGQPALPEPEQETEQPEVIDAEYTEVSEEPAEDLEEKQEVFDTISKHAGEDLKILENSGMYSVRTVKGNSILLTSVGTRNSFLHVDPEVLRKHVGHECICRGDTYGDKMLRTTIKCIGCNEIIWAMDNPEEELGYEYDAPEE